MKRYILSLVICLCVVGVKAQDMANLFTNMPDQLIPQLENAWRKDLIDLYNSDKEARLQNTMQGYSVLKSMTNDYLFLQLTERSTIQMKMLPLVNNTHIICLVNTVYGPVPDSNIQFYTTEWEPLDTSDLFTPATDGWYWADNIDKTNLDYQFATSRLDIELIKYELSPSDLTLKATYTTPLYLSNEEREKINPFLKSTPKVYTWERYQFK